MNEIIYRESTPDDMTAVLNLIQELAIYEKAPDAVVTTVEDLIQDGFGSTPRFRCLVAELDSKVVGIALFYPKYSTWKGKGIFLEDLIVTESQRGNGIGKKLLQMVIDEAHAFGSGRLEWQVLDWNEPSIEFYRAMGAALDGEWINCQLTRAQLAELQGK